MSLITEYPYCKVPALEGRHNTGLLHKVSSHGKNAEGCISGGLHSTYLGRVTCKSTALWGYIKKKLQLSLAHAASCFLFFFSFFSVVTAICSL